MPGNAVSVSRHPLTMSSSLGPQENFQSARMTPSTCSTTNFAVDRSAGKRVVADRAFVVGSVEHDDVAHPPI